MTYCLLSAHQASFDKESTLTKFATKNLFLISERKHTLLEAPQ